MKNEKIEYQDIIKDRKKLPVEQINKIKNNIFLNCIIFVIMIFFTIIINILFKELSINNFNYYMDNIRMIFCIFSIFIFELAYRKDSEKIGVYGIEFLVYSICVLFVPHMFISKNNNNFLIISVELFFIYYIVKSFVTFIFIKRAFLKNSISDVREIVKEYKKGYLNEDSFKELKIRNKK